MDEFKIHRVYFPPFKLSFGKEEEEYFEDENVGQICLNNPIIGNSIKISLRKSFFFVRSIFHFHRKLLSMALNNAVFVSGIVK
jgi:hypothetical protein